MAFNFLRKQSVVDINDSGETSALNNPVQYHKVSVYADGIYPNQSI